MHSDFFHDSIFWSIAFFFQKNLTISPTLLVFWKTFCYLTKVSFFKGGLDTMWLSAFSILWHDKNQPCLSAPYASIFFVYLSNCSITICWKRTSSFQINTLFPGLQNEHEVSSLSLSWSPDETRLVTGLFFFAQSESTFAFVWDLVNLNSPSQAVKIAFRVWILSIFPLEVDGTDEILSTLLCDLRSHFGSSLKSDSKWKSLVEMAGSKVGKDATKKPTLKFDPYN